MGKNTGVRGVEEQAMEENFVLEKLNGYVDRMCMADGMYLKAAGSFSRLSKGKGNLDDAFLVLLINL